MLYQITLHVANMDGPHPESAISSTLHNFFTPRHVIFHTKEGIIVMVTAEKIPEQEFHDILDPTNHQVLSYSCIPYHKDQQGTKDTRKEHRQIPIVHTMRKVLHVSHHPKPVQSEASGKPHKIHILPQRKPRS